MTVHKSIVSDIDGAVQRIIFNSGEHQIDVYADRFVVDGVNEYNSECVDDLLALVTATKSEYVTYQANKARRPRVLLIQISEPA